jgi:hypothetical protein
MAQRLTIDGQVRLKITLNNDGTVSGRWEFLDTELSSAPTAVVWIGEEVIKHALRLAGNPWPQYKVRRAFERLARMAHPQRTKSESEEYWRHLTVAGPLDDYAFELNNLEMLTKESEFAVRLTAEYQGGEAWRIVSTLMPYLRQAAEMEPGSGARSEAAIFAALPRDHPILDVVTQTGWLTGERCSELVAALDLEGQYKPTFVRALHRLDRMPSSWGLIVEEGVYDLRRLAEVVDRHDFALDYQPKSNTVGKLLIQLRQVVAELKNRGCLPDSAESDAN